MKWTPGYKSNDVEDRRGQGGRGGGGMGLLLGLGARFGIPGVVLGAILLFVVPRFLGGDSASGQQQSAPQSTEAEQRLVEFTSFVFDDTQATWAAKIPNYHPAKLILFSGSTDTACGYGDAAVGPFYCPRDQHVYIDLSFYRELKQRFGSPGDFAQAYVIAHEMGHHVQQVARLQTKGVQMELQADCLAGVWANTTEKRKLLDAGDIQEAMTAAAAIGDDAIQKQQGGNVRPDKFTHGSSAQRVAAFRRGYQKATLEGCTTSENDTL